MVIAVTSMTAVMAMTSVASASPELARDLVENFALVRFECLLKRCRGFGQSRQVLRTALRHVCAQAQACRCVGIASGSLSPILKH